MTILKTLSAAALAVGFWAAPATAQQAPRHEQNQADLPGPIDSLDDLQDTAKMVFKLADENLDGQISQKEAVDAVNLTVGGFFFRADQNGDGALSAEEAKAAREAFLQTKPWLRYALETARTARTGGNAGGNDAGNAAGNATSRQGNMVAMLASALDSNNDKKIEASELRQAVQTGVQGAFATADTNRDGQLSPAELNAAVAGMSRQVAQASFQQADTDNNGQISQAEFEKAIVQPARVAFQIVDLNHDGQISPQEAQTARRVVMSRARALQIQEPANSPRNRVNRALGNQAQPAPVTPPAPPSR